MNILPAAQIGEDFTQLFAPVSLDLPNPLVHANYAAQCDAAARRSLLSRNLPCRVEMPAVTLLRYPAGTLVSGDRSYLTVAGDAVVLEQVAPWCTDPHEEARQMRAQPERAHDVAVPCLLLARFGENTWGHWVADMLAKAAIAEQIFPGRFHYAVPWWTTQIQGSRGFSNAVLESLAAYGIAPERLVRLGASQIYRFATLHDVTGIWRDGPHPGALQSLQAAAVPKSKGPKRRRIALLRHPPEARSVHNADEVRLFLQNQGFAAVNLNEEPFAAQVRLFRDAEWVVGSLGSSFTGALHARPGAKMITLAPAVWTDGYFIRLFQHTLTNHFDLRGPAPAQEGVPIDRSPHLVDIGELATAMSAARMADPEGTGACLVDGELMPRRFGSQLLNLTFAGPANVAATYDGAWSDPEPSHRWSLGESSGLRLAGTSVPRDAPIWLELAGQGHVYPPRLPTRPLTVLVNGRQAGCFDVIGRARYVCRITPDMLAGHDDIRLTFLHPVCPTPRMMGAGSDDRPLGFGFESLNVYATSAGWAQPTLLHKTSSKMMG